MTTNESAPDPTAGERRWCSACLPNDCEHDRPATPPADAASEPVTEADDAKAHAARIGASYGRELADRDSDDGNDPVERVRGRRVTEPDLDWNASTEASNDHWTCGGCGYEGNGPDNVEWIEHTKVCPAEKHGKAMPADDASTDASEPNIVQRIVNAWECCGTCAGGVLASYVRDREADAATKARADERERIAQAIESEQKQRLWPRILDFGDGMLRAARIARGDA